MVDARLAGIRETAAGNKTVLDGHVSSIEGSTMDAKRKWQEFSLQAENDAKDSADFSAAKHCRFELLLQKCVETTDMAMNHCKKTTHESVTNLSELLLRTMSFMMLRSVLHGELRKRMR
ncbi:putative kinesin-like protein [Helianthus anomalus]